MGATKKRKNGLQRDAESVLTHLSLANENKLTQGKTTDDEAQSTEDR